jgi:hypothetical protein
MSPMTCPSKWMTARPIVLLLRAAEPARIRYWALAGVPWGPEPR